MSAASLSARSTALARVSYLIGRWEGEGQMHNAAGSHHFMQAETVRPCLDGELLTVEGLGRDRDDPSKRIHAALAVLSYDPERERYWWRAYCAGQWADSELHLDTQGFSWTLESAPGMVTRYTAIIDGDA